MAWTTMHFAVGMGCTGIVASAVCYALRRGWRWIPAAMTLGGVWALVPDMPRIFWEDLPHTRLTRALFTPDLQAKLHSWGDLFFFHRMLDNQPNEYSLHGLAIILMLYNMSIGLLMYLEHRQRNSLANRSWRTHSDVLRKVHHTSERKPASHAVAKSSSVNLKPPRLAS